MNDMKEHDRAVLMTDMPADKLEARDVGTVVHVHESGNACEVEFVALGGQTVALVTLDRRQLRPVEHR